jgi:hypothetical protein
MRHIARFVPPHMDKHWSFQVVFDELPPRGDFLVAMTDPLVKVTEPYLQGYDERSWAMIEFWKGGEDAARTAALRLAEKFSTTLLEGNFTRKELGLE